MGEERESIPFLKRVLRPVTERWFFFAILVLGAGLDLVTKELAFSPGGELVSSNRIHWVLGEWFGFSRTMNPGAIWGIGHQYSGLLLIIRFIVFVFIFFYVFRIPAARKGHIIGLGLVSAGALGNLYDNLFTRPHGFTWDFLELFRNPGMVRDFIHVDLGIWPLNPWPDFNIADSMILVGVIILFLFTGSRSKAKYPLETKEKKG